MLLTRIIALSIGSLATVSFAQNTFPATGNVLIGTTSGGDPLTVSSSVAVAGYFGVVSNSTNVTNNVGTPLSLRNTSATNGNYSAFLFYDANWNVQGSIGLMYGPHTGQSQGTFYIEPRIVSIPSAFVVSPSGNVGIGTVSPGANLEVVGNVKLSGNGANITFPDGSNQSVAWNGILSGGDYAESVDVAGKRTAYEPGDVLVIDPEHEGSFMRASEPYSTAVTGIYSTRPGALGRRQKTDATHIKDEVPMAMTGIVPTKVTTANGAIKPGDLLVTSSEPGFAMKGTDRTLMLGAVIGKALGHLDTKTGVIEIVVTLQ